MRKLKEIAKLCFVMVVTTCGTSSRLSSDQLPDGTEYYFSIFGDSRDGNDIYSTLQNRSTKAGKPLATIHLGDMISTHHNTEQWPSFVSLTRTYVEDGKFYPVIGNHDVADEKSLDLFLAVFPEMKKGYIAEKIGDCFCIFLNSEDREDRTGVIGPTQLSWLQEELWTLRTQNSTVSAGTVGPVRRGELAVQYAWMLLTYPRMRQSSC